jgi:hypothetical protein
MTTLTRIACLGGWFSACAVAGCATEPQKSLVSGTVTLDAKPLKEGIIRFVPTDGNAPTTDGPIVAGRFSVPVLPGDKTVQISAPKVVGKRRMYDTPDSPEVDEVEELIPAHYNVRSQLTLKVEQGPQEKAFDLKSK